jgi:hypothetical protein
LVPIGAARIGHGEEAQGALDIFGGGRGAGLGAAVLRPQQPTGSRKEGREQSQQNPSFHDGGWKRCTSLADPSPHLQAQSISGEFVLPPHADA